MSSILRNSYGDIRGWWWLGLEIFILFGICWWTWHGDKEVTGTYCTPANQCTYRDEAMNSKTCPLFWDNTSLFGSANHLKLKPGTCKIIPKY